MSPEWESAYAAGKIDPTGVGHLYYLLGMFCHGHQERVLELGCGLGGNVHYWLQRSSDYYGIDGSETATRGLLEKYPYLGGHVTCGDFTIQASTPDNWYDVVFDRASISHNAFTGIESALAAVHRTLKPGGIFVGCDWFSTNHSEIQRGTYDGDFATRQYEDGQFAGIGKVHFSSRKEIDDLFSNFQGVFLQERQTIRPPPNGRFITDVNPFRWVSRYYDDKEYVSAVWDIIARKP